MKNKKRDINRKKTKRYSRGKILETKLEKNFFLETRYEIDIKRMKPFLIVAFVVPIYLPIFLPMYFLMKYLMKKQYEVIAQMRDEQREVELLNIIQERRYSGYKTIYAHYALIDLGNKQVKNIVMERIIQLDRFPYKNSFTTTNVTVYGIMLAYINKSEQEDNWGK
jgi:hypothetical protein